MNEAATTLTRLEALMEPFRRSSAPGGCAAIARNGTLVWRSCFGMASLEHSRAHGPSSRIAAGSVTKQFTSAALLLLADDGVLSLDDSVGRWLPELRGDVGRPTLRQLMTHTGGVRCHLDLAVFSGYVPIPAGGALRTLQRQRELSSLPGSRASYSNGGYVLLSAVIERASGCRLEDVLRTRLFEPIGMFSTGLPRHASITERPGESTLYVPASAASGWRPADPLAEELLGEGGVVTTVDDLLRWAALLRDPRSPVTLARLACPVTLANGVRSDYGFGVFREKWRGVEVVNHVGGLPGGNAILATLPRENIDVALLFNRNADMRSLTLDILDILLGDRLEPRPESPRAGAHRDLIGRFVAKSAGFLFEFQGVGDELRLAVFGGSPILLESRAENDGLLPFGVEVGLGEMRFKVLERREGLITALQFSDSGTWHTALRLDQPATSANELVQSAPETFANAEAGATLRFGLLGDKLVVHATGEFGSSICPAEVLAPNLVRFHDPQYASGPLADIELGRGGHASRVIVSMPRTARLVFEVSQ